MEYIVIACYFATLIAIGVVAARRIENSADYYVGGKRLGFWVVAFSARATGESAWLLLGLTGLGAAVGLQAMWVVAGEVLGVSAAWFLMARPFKRLTDEYDSITVPDYLVSRFSQGGGTAVTTGMIRVFGATALALFVTIYVSAQIDATGKAFDAFLGWNYYTGVIVGFGIVVAYTLFGGFIAVSWSDLMQGSLMLIGLTVLPIAAYFSIPDASNVWSELSAMGEGMTSIWGADGFGLETALVCLSYFAIGWGFLGSPQVFVRFISIRDDNEILKGRWVALAFTLLTDTGAVAIGMLGRYILVGDGDITAIIGADGEDVLPNLVEHTFPAIVVGLYIAAVLGAIMSTIDSLLVVASSAVTHDLFQGMLRPNLKGTALTRLSRVVTLGLALLALTISIIVSIISPDRTIFWYVVFGWSGIAATFCPAIILSLCWPRFNGPGALISMIVGFFGVPFFKFAVPLMGDVGALISKAEELAPSILLALCAGIATTLISSNKKERSGQSVASDDE